MITKTKKYLFITTILLIFFEKSNYASLFKISDTKAKIDTCILKDLTVIYKHYDENPQLPITINLFTSNGTNKIMINDISNVVNETLNSFIIKCSDERLILEYKEIMNAYSYIFNYHLFDRDSVTHVYYLTKTYYRTSDRQGFTLEGSKTKNKISIEKYDPKYVKDNKYIEIYSSTSFQEDTEPSLTEYYNKVMQSFKSGNRDNFALLTDIFILERIFKGKFSDTANIITINNIGYYLEQSKLYKEAIYILENLLKYHPSRTVAYLNLGDAYWGAKRTDEAKKAYKTYMEQMNAQGKGSKIPEYVVKRVE